VPPADPGVDSAAELVVVAEMTAQALDAGYAGLRMFADGPTGRGIRCGGSGRCATST
jgi:hypothetical protein